MRIKFIGTSYPCSDPHYRIFVSNNDICHSAMRQRTRNNRTKRSSGRYSLYINLASYLTELKNETFISNARSTFDSPLSPFCPITDTMCIKQPVLRQNSCCSHSRVDKYLDLDNLIHLSRHAVSYPGIVFCRLYSYDGAC